VNYGDRFRQFKGLEQILAFFYGFIGGTDKFAREAPLKVIC